VDTLSRLITALVLLTVAGSAWSYGTVPKTGTETRYWFTTSTNGALNSTRGATAVQACEARADALNAANAARQYDVTDCNGTTGACNITDRTRATGVIVTADVCGSVGSDVYAANSCPAFSVAVGDLCACQAGYAPDGAGTQCVLPDANECASRRTDAAEDYEMAVWNKRTTACSGGCVVQGAYAAGKTDGSGTIYDAKATGATCDPNAATGSGDNTAGDDATPAPVPLEPGQCSGTVNGTAVVVPCGAGTTTKTESKTTTQNGDGTKTTVEKSTECVDGGGCKTTTTTTGTSATGAQTGKNVTVTDGVDFQDRNSLGGQGGAATPGEQEDQPGLCEEYPDIPACKESTFSSSCAAGAAPQCDGDAVQCAIASEQHRRNCAFFDQTNTSSEQGTAAVAAGVEGDTDHPNRNPTEHEIGTFDQTNLIGGSCPADRILGTGTATVSIPFSQICGPASSLGLLLVGITALSCIAIVFRGS
jgi:hypothetical protein